MAIEITPEAEAKIEAIIDRSRTVRQAELDQQAAGGKRWWASFELLSGNYEIHSPSWVSGYGRGPTVVFAGIAESEDALMEHIENSCLDEGSSVEWRFVEPRADDFIPPYTDRFPGPSSWHVWPGVPLQPLDEYLEATRKREIDDIGVQAEITEELKTMSLTKLIGRSLMESGEVDQDSVEAITEILEENLRRGQKLAEGI